MHNLANLFVNYLFNLTSMQTHFTRCMHVHVDTFYKFFESTIHFLNSQKKTTELKTFVFSGKCMDLVKNTTFIFN